MYSDKHECNYLAMVEEHKEEAVAEQAVAEDPEQEEVEEVVEQELLELLHWKPHLLEKQHRNL
jgi:hypothetical protein